MVNGYAETLFFQAFIESLGHINGTVTTAGAADADGKTGLTFTDIERDREAKKIHHLHIVLFGLVMFFQEIDDRLILTAEHLQLRNIERVRQETHIAGDVAVARDTVLKSERLDMDIHRALIFDFDDVQDLFTKRGKRDQGRVDDVCR